MPNNKKKLYNIIEKKLIIKKNDISLPPTAWFSKKIKYFVLETNLDKL